MLLLVCVQDNCSDISYRSLTHAIDMEQQPLWNGRSRCRCHNLRIHTVSPLCHAPCLHMPQAAAWRPVTNLTTTCAGRCKYCKCRSSRDGSLRPVLTVALLPDCAGEYYVALDQAGEAAATQEILQHFQAVAESRGLARPSKHLWLHVRYVGGDTSSFLNPCYGHAVCAAFELALVAPSMDAPLPPWDEWAAYFGAMEDVLRSYGGRPHHAKYYTSDVPAVPGFGLPVREFMKACRQFDPERLLRNDKFDAVFLTGVKDVAETTSEL